MTGCEAGPFVGLAGAAWGRKTHPQAWTCVVYKAYCSAWPTFHRAAGQTHPVPDGGMKEGVINKGCIVWAAERPGAWTLRALGVGCQQSCDGNLLHW